MTTKRTKQTPIAFNDRQREMIAEIQQKTGFDSIAKVMQSALQEYHKRMFKDYIVNRGGGIATKMTPEQRAEHKFREKSAMKKIAEETVEAEDTKICVDILGGEVVEKNGGKVCQYHTYNYKTRFDLEVPLEMVDEGYANGQYFPDRATVERLQAEGKTYYRVTKK